ncbi:DarT ssDNA thymidine ADP-ribosyltransferase family protein, partial [Nodularia sp. UHCC 0506]|uniref:DarT ssDNA thymidine ADP-ribosyltransferase family protein n=1 Tax=Nodularia sp. UHCC 0506 TaxID=3110243 RepID=UPI002B1E9558
MDILKEYGIKYLYHMTYINNLASIIRNGLLSHNEAYRRGLIAADISDPDVQDRRANLSVYNIPLHEYVPLYFSPRNPMLYKRREIQEDIVILGMESQIL